MGQEQLLLSSNEESWLKAHLQLLVDANTVVAAKNPELRPILRKLKYDEKKY